jgi:L-ascorbate metabolism protein UlaG (beta-lactamase superfamily)
MLNLQFLGHSCFLFDDGKYKVIIDPFITNNPAATVKAEDISADYVIVTHGHGDHLGDSLTIAKHCDATIIANDEIANYALSKGLKAHNMHIGGGFDYPFGRVKLTIAHHGSAAPGGAYMGNPVGVVFNMGGKTIYHAGDTGLFLDMKLIGELNKIDIMCLPIGDNFTMGVDDGVKAVEFVNPALAIPMHYNTFPLIAADPNDFKAKVEKNGNKCTIMNVNDTINF